MSTPKSKSRTATQRSTDGLLKAWLACPRDEEHERDITERFIGKALDLMEKGQLQKTVNELIQTGRLQDFNDGIDLNFQAQCLSTLATAESETNPEVASVELPFDEFHLVAMSWTGEVAAFELFENRDFREQLGGALEMHFRDVLGIHAKDGTPSFALRLPAFLAHPAALATLPSDDKYRILRHMFEQDDEAGFQALVDLQHQMIGKTETPDYDGQLVIGERLILLGVAFTQNDFPSNFNLAIALAEAAENPDAWAGVTLAPEHTFFMPPLPLNGALIDSLCSHLQNHLMVNLNSDDPDEELIVDNLDLQYNAHHHCMMVSATSNDEEIMDISVPMEWFYAGGVSSPDILRHLIGETEENDEEDAAENPYAIKADGTLVSSNQPQHPKRDALDEQLDKIMPSILRPPGSTRIH